MVGHVPGRGDLKAASGSLIDYVEVIQFSRPSEFLDHAKKEDIQIVCAELVQGARSLSSYTFTFDRHLCLVVGNEESGVPSEIMVRSEVIYIPMRGIGYCLNTSQAANILMYEAVNQYERK